jgi:Fic family protein
MESMRERMHHDFTTGMISQAVLDELAAKQGYLCALLADRVDAPELELSLARYDEAFEVRMAYNSNAIEGSTLTLAETAEVLDGKLIATHEAREQLAARGIADGMAYARRMVADRRVLSEELIKDIHERTALDIDYRLRGRYRQTNVFLRGSEVVPPPASAVKNLMGDLVYMCESSPLSAIERALVFHVYFEFIHPFADGNGRIGRSLLNYQLLLHNYPPLALRYDRAHSYLSALALWQLEAKTEPFTLQVVESLRSELASRLALVNPLTAQSASSSS